LRNPVPFLCGIVRQITARKIKLASCELRGFIRGAHNPDQLDIGLARHMKLSAFEAVAKALADAGVRYLVVGGLAVNAHGYVRFTADIDLVVALDVRNIDAAFSALAAIGYRPSVPITAAQFGDEQQRQGWVANKNMQVLNFFSDRHRGTSVDMFVYEPFDFEAEYDAALVADLLPGVPMRYVSIPALIRMKEEAGRPRDQDDIEHLRLILESEQRNE
jgi:hypothetical protein